MKEKQIKCVQCNKPFIINGREWEYIMAMSLAEPKVCPSCQKNESMGMNWKRKRKNADKKKHYRLKYEP